MSPEPPDEKGDDDHCQPASDHVSEDLGAQPDTDPGPISMTPTAPITRLPDTASVTKEGR